jgi:predicted RNA-binding Zn ribbon-like protein
VDDARRLGRDPELPRLLGDCLCLDFANTVEDRTGPHPVDTLTDYARLVRWGWHAGELTLEQRDHLSDESAHRPGEAAATLARAITLREAIYRVFAAIAHGATPERADLAVIESANLAALAPAHLARRDEWFEWTWDDAPVLDRPLWPVARSAIELLMSDRLSRVKQCPGTDDCGWLFLDLSKNGARRWCSMESCGSRAKMRRHYARRRSGLKGRPAV